MDIGKLKNNTGFYNGYEGEGEIILSLAVNESYSIHIWDGYFGDIFENPEASENGWTGFTKDYSEDVRSFPSGGMIGQADISEYLLDLLKYRDKGFSFPETSSCLELLIMLFEFALSKASSIIVDIQ